MRWLERGLMVTALASLGYCVGLVGQALVYQAYESAELDQILGMGPGGGGRSTGRALPVAAGSVLGRIEIPSLGVSTIVKEGVDARTLRLAVGHIAGTAMPGDRGNLGLAGHRDTFFRALRNVKRDELIRLVTYTGTFTYRVDRTFVVQPEDVWVLDATAESTLTLVTCFPFSYIGSAPQRFVVRANRIDDSAPVTRDVVNR